MVMRAILILLLVVSGGIHAQDWLQRGLAINGDALDDQAGTSVSMPDANTIAVGAPDNDSGGPDSGQVRVFTWATNAWQQKGPSIVGWGENSGQVVCMPDSNTVGIAAPYALLSYGRVRVFAWSGNAWLPKGAPIDGTANEGFAGTALSMPDANTVAIGAPQADNVGVVRVYAWNGTAWAQRGSDIVGPIGGGYAGGSVSMPDPNTVAVGAPNYAGGYVRVFFWNGVDWSQKGADIEGESVSDGFGTCVSMPDANTLAAGSPNNGNNGIAAGQMRVFTWNVSTWVQKGQNIQGEAFDHLGTTMGMPDENTLAIGAPGNFQASNDTGYVRVFVWDGGAWVQRGSDIAGEEAANYPGYAVCMPDTQTVGLGAFQNNTSDLAAGQARIYGYGLELPVVEVATPSSVWIHPNPAQGPVTLQLAGFHGTVQVTVRNALGGKVLHQQYPPSQCIELGIPGGAGVYYVEVIAGGQRSVAKVVLR